jgi:hypothetical protein
MAVYSFANEFWFLLLASLPLVWGVFSVVFAFYELYVWKKSIIRPVRSDFYDKVKNEAVIGRIQGAFSYSSGKGGERKSACDILFTQNYVLQVYRPELNVVPGIFGFSATDTFRQNIGNSKVSIESMRTVSDLNPDPKSISEAISLEKIEVISLECLTLDSGSTFDHYKVDVAMMYLRMGGRFAGVRENILFTKMEFENAVNMVNKTPLSGKLQVKRKTVS